jgi:transcription termination factor Rho
VLETPRDPRNFSARVVDLISPIGFGQRGLIVSPPRAGKTHAARGAVQRDHRQLPKAKVMMFLVDERPEEVTAPRAASRAESSPPPSTSRPSATCTSSERVAERARSWVESGHDVIVFMDSLTRLGRAYNNVARTTGRILSGGLESNALQRPKRFFGSARNVDGRRLAHHPGHRAHRDQLAHGRGHLRGVQGTGNMEIVLSRSISEQRIFPAIDLNKSGTRMEDLLYDPDEARLVKSLRAALADLPPVEAIEKLLEKLRKTATNAEFLLT